MTPKQILDSFSVTLVRDERILSTQERVLVVTVLQHAKAATGKNQETQEAVRAVIASAIGETVAQRAFAVLGGSIVERILEGSTLPLNDSVGERTPDIFAGNPGEPQPPSQGPGPSPTKAPHKAPQPPSAPMGTPGEPQPPSQGPGPSTTKAPHKGPQPPSAPMRTPGEPQPPSPRPSRRSRS